jgi:hypothetical protein
MRTATMLSALAALALPASGTPVFTYDSRYSQLSISGQIPQALPPEDYYYLVSNAGGMNPFNRSITDELHWNGLSAGSTADQNSVLSAAAVSVSTHTYMHVESTSGTGAGSAWAWSLFETVVVVSQVTPVELSGGVHIPPGCGPPWRLTCLVTLKKETGTTWTQLYAAQGEQPIGYATTLAPGRYRLNAESYAGGDTSHGTLPIHGSAFLDCTLQIVPEPAALVMFLLTLSTRRGR